MKRATALTSAKQRQYRQTHEPIQSTPTVSTPMRLFDESSIPTSVLKEEYQRLCCLLVEQHREQYECSPSESFFDPCLSRYLDSEYYHSFWIENHCFDFFLPSYRMLLEVDGSVHFGEAKMKKDNFKEECARSLGLFIYRLENYEVKKYPLRTIGKIKSCPSIDSVITTLLMRRIYLHTLSRHSSYRNLQKLFRDFENSNK
ncbi:MAG: DUF559 domain-containing protein [Oligoflexia bacterium]|nr:DUF559 domain-containing protein [Oligoflexia bacterium]